MESGQVWDIVQAAKSLRQGKGADGALIIRGQGTMAVNALYASLFSDGIHRLELSDPPATHRSGPTYLNILRLTDVPEVVLLASDREDLHIAAAQPEQWKPMQEAAGALGLAAKIHIVTAATPLAQ